MAWSNDKYCNTVFYLKRLFYYYYIHQNRSLRLSYKNEFLNAHNILFSKIEKFLAENNNVVNAKKYTNRINLKQKVLFNLIRQKKIN